MFLALFVLVSPSAASVNLRLIKNGSHDVELKRCAGSFSDDIDTITTTGTTPYVSTRGLSRDLEKNEVYLSFEYTSTAAVSDLAVFFGSIANNDIQYCQGLAKAESWTTYMVDISDALEKFSWGKMGEQLTLRFGNQADVTLMVRHLRICKGEADPWVPTSNMPVIRNSIFRMGLPVFDIHTVDSIEPTCDYVKAPAGSMGGGITNATKVPGSLDIYFTDSITPDYSSGAYEKDKAGMTLKIRGNGSAYLAKKPFKIKLQKKANLMLTGDDKTYKDKEWLLLNDKELQTPIGFKVNELMGLQWTPRCRYVNVIVNGDYRGLYLLAEGVKRNTTARLNVAEDGYIIEHDAYWWNEDSMFVNSKYSPSFNYTFKYPDWEDMTQEQIDYIQNCVTTFEKSVENGTYPQYIDVESLASWVLGHDLLGTLDGGGSNMYFTKYDSTDSTKLQMANMWDFDSIEMTPDKWSDVHTYRFSNDYFNNDNKEFSRQYVKKWNQIKETFFADIQEYLNSLAINDETAAYDTSVIYNNMRWNSYGKSMADDVKSSCAWFETRQTWMQTAVETIDTVDTPSYIQVPVVRTDMVTDIYDLSGRRINSNQNNAAANGTRIYLERTGGRTRKVIAR